MNCEYIRVENLKDVENAVETLRLEKNEIETAAHLIQKGELVAFPTETVYGLGADATNEEAVGKVYLAKGRPSDNPLIVHVENFEQVESFAQGIPSYAKKLVDKFWPGPLTIILKVKDGALSKVVTGGLNTVAFRMPNNQVTLDLIHAASVPLVGPSANTSGKPSPTSAEHVLHDLNGKISAVLDDGETQIGVESTVLDLSEDGVATILRPGAITFEMLRDEVPHLQVDKHLVSESETPKAPGLKYKHYSPNAEVYMVESYQFFEAVAWAKENYARVGVLADVEIIQHVEKLVDETFVLTKGHNVFTAMHNLFNGLRTLDGVTPPLDILLVESFESRAQGVAYMNRLAKAAGGKKFEL
jgi:L-threonylcarbamoyladenylate synthase